jgi:hypothetical protein
MSQSQPGELSPETLFKTMSLKELSIAARDLSTALSQATQDDEFLQACQDYISDATADKIDGYSFVAAYLEAEIAAWQEKKNKLLEMVDEIIARKQRELEMLKSSLLRLYSLGLIDNKLEGKTRAIAIQPSPPKITNLLIAPDSPDFPEEFRDVRVEYKVKVKALVDAWKAGENIDAIAEVEQGWHVRFRHKRVR